MIVFDRLWILMKQKKITQYKLIHTFNVSKGQLDRIKNNKNITTNTIDLLCNILDCNVEDIMEHRKDKTFDIQAQKLHQKQQASRKRKQ